MTTEPKTRGRLLVEHAAARRRRDAAHLGSDAYRTGCDDVARIEVEIARLERSMTPPQM